MTATFPLSPYMNRALELAREAEAAGEVPIGAVVVKEGRIIGEGNNRTRRDHDPSAHAEIVAIRAAASALGNDRLTDCDLWVTLEPCPMCAGAITHARVARLYYAASDPKGGGVEHGAQVFTHATCHHKPEVFEGIAAEEAGAMLREFFAGKR